MGRPHKRKMLRTAPPRTAPLYDPLKLDGTPYAEELERRRIQSENDPFGDRPDERNLVHPLLTDHAVAKLVEQVCAHTDTLWRCRHPEGDMTEDAYCECNEGLTLRLPVLVRLLLSELRAHPELLR